MISTGCRFTGCLEPHTAKGWCSKHYQHVRVYGKPETFKRVYPPGAAVEFFHAHIADVTDECMLWPFNLSSTGYGVLFIDGRRVSVYREACRYWWGDPPDPKMQAAHGRLRRCVSNACWNGDHLSWKDTAGQTLDKYRDGTIARGERHGSAKLTETQAREILEQDAAGVTVAALASRYGVTPKTVLSIVTGRSWSHIDWDGLRAGRRQGAKLREADIVVILDLYFIDHMSQADIAERFGVSASTIKAIVQRRTWKHVQWPPQPDEAPKPPALRQA